MIDFPATPTVGQTFTSGGQSWTWDGTKWLPAGLYGGPFVPQAGFVPAMNDNRIINGDMRIDQRNAGAAGTGNSTYTVDRWGYNGTVAGKMQWQQAPATGAFPYCLNMASLSAYTPAAAEGFFLVQAIEADMVSDFQWGTAQAQPVTLSFWIGSSIAGTFGGAVLNAAQTRSYPFSFSVPTANVWTKIIITIPGDTGGTWVLKGNGVALYVRFDLGTGATYRGPAGAWASANYIGANGTVQSVATNGATYGLTGVKLEIGSIATPFNRQSLAKSMADCQRYYEKSYDLATAPGTITTNGGSFIYTALPAPASGGTTVKYSVTKRATPTVTFYSGLTGSFNAIFDQGSNVDVAPTLLSPGQQGFGWYAASSTQAGINFLAHWIADAEL